MSVNAMSTIVDVIIPVYGGVAEVEACLESVLASENSTLGDVIVVNDCSPEPEIHEYLSKLSDAGLIKLIINDENLGFVRSCNLAASLQPENDFLLLNADTEVHGDWLDRIAAHARRHHRIASVSPFSNNATIASYPWGGNSRDASTDINVAELDRAMASANPGESLSLPTAIGFCMFVSREAWQQAGGFDERYGRGYGEEVEFCLATAAQGWDHLLACDVFVYHAGNISFGYDSEQLKTDAQKIVDQRYPDFSRDVQEWIKQDPALPARLRCDLQRLNPGKGPRILHVCHALGGGVLQHVQDLTAACSAHSDGVNFMLLPWGKNAISIEAVGGRGAFAMRLPGPDAEQRLSELLDALGIQRIHYHHYAGLPQWILEVPSRLSLPYDVTIHDFVAACPQYHFQTSTGRFCGRPSIAGCRACVDDRPDEWNLGIEQWRARFSEHLSGAARVICPSHSAAEATTSYYPDSDCVVWPHFDTQTEQFNAHQTQRPLRIKVAIVGALSHIKGFELVSAVIRYAEQTDLPLDFVVVGPTIKPLHRETRAAVTGPYRRELLPDILVRERPDCFFFASQVPETFNYALSGCMATGLPIVAISCGAIEERLKDVSSATLLPVDSGVEAVVGALLKQVHAGAAMTSETQNISTTAVTAADYAARYLAPLDDPEELNQQRLLTVLSALADLEKPLAAPLPPLGELLNAALEQLNPEAQAALRRHTHDSHAILEERERHLEIRAAEVRDLTQTIVDLKRSNDREETHLKDQIERLQTANAVEVEHLHDVVQTLEAARFDIAIQRDEIAIQLEGAIADRERLAARVEELENSTLWRLLTPVRWGLHQIKMGGRGALPLLKFCKKAFVFSRYHYSMGGWGGLQAALVRRTTRLLQRGHASPSRQIQPEKDFALMPPAEATITQTETPDLSIVIPSYGEHAVTANCLRSIAAHPPSLPYEVIVADDAYPEPFDAAGFDIRGVSVHRNEQNLGFLLNCNEAVARAKGRRVLLLNNDTQVLEGAIDALWRTFDDHDRVGAVGSKLLYPSGLLQEAGGIIWRDGSGWNWGRDEDPSLPRFNYVRNVDYCSAAALMVDREAWTSVGGFDEQFAPCYYEDTDLCFALRKKGWRTLYQPASRVVHFEGVSHGTDTDTGPKAYQVRNQDRFASKWEAELAAHALNGQNPNQECDRQARLSILWVEACMLTPNQDSGSLRTLRLLRILRDIGCRVTFVADNLLADEPYAQALRDAGIEVLHAPHVHSLKEFLTRRGGEYDVVTLCRHYIAIQYVELIKATHPSTTVWFDTIDLHYLRLQRQYELDTAAATQKMAELAYAEEMEVIKKSDLTIVVSESEVAALEDEVPTAPVALISNIHDIDESEVSVDGRSDVLFVGGFQHPPNIDAVEYFGNDIWPHFKAACPEAEALVIGSRMPETLKRWGEERGLTMIGFVDDLKPYYEQCRLAIAPLRYGAGVKGKVNQALSYGVPVIGSQTALEGMGLRHGEDAMVADAPDSFARAMVSVYNDDELWQLLSSNGQASLQGRFTPDVAKAALELAIRDVKGKASF